MSRQEPPVRGAVGGRGPTPTTPPPAQQKPATRRPQESPMPDLLSDELTGILSAAHRAVFQFAAQANALEAERDRLRRLLAGPRVSASAEQLHLTWPDGATSAIVDRALFDVIVGEINHGRAAGAEIDHLRGLLARSLRLHADCPGPCSTNPAVGDIEREAAL